MMFSRRINQIQGPRPASLTLNTIQSSVKFKKPAPPQKTTAKLLSRCPFDPIIVYLRSPTIIHVKPEEFMDLVQRLTGYHSFPNNASSSSASSCGNDKCCLNGTGLTLATPSGLISPDFGYKVNFPVDFAQAFEL